MKAVNFVGQLLLFLWQLPQNLLGLIIFVGYLCGLRREYVECRGRKVFVYDGFPGGVSLGNFIFVGSFEPGSWDVVRHECGHAIQSLMLGPLYLIVVGLPSLVWAGLHRWTGLRKYDYYAFYTERWADRLGGVER